MKLDYHKIASLPTLDQTEDYKKSYWLNLDEACKKALSTFDKLKINRQDIIDAFSEYYKDKSDFRKPFLLCMIWGYAGSGYGNHRVNNYLTEPEKLEKGFQLILENNHEEAYKAFNSIKGLGISFISKLMYFASNFSSFSCCFL